MLQGSESSNPTKRSRTSFENEFLLSQEAEDSIVAMEVVLVEQRQKKFGETNFALDMSYSEDDGQFPINMINVLRGDSRKQGHHVLAFSMYETLLRLKLFGVEVSDGIGILLLSLENLAFRDILPGRLRSEQKQEIITENTVSDDIEAFRKECELKDGEVRHQQLPEEYRESRKKALLEGNDNDKKFWITYLNGEAARWLFALKFCAENYIRFLDSNPLMRFGSEEDIRGEGSRVTAGVRLFSAILGYIDYVKGHSPEIDGPLSNFWQYGLTREGSERINPATSFAGSLRLSINQEEIKNPPLLGEIYRGNNLAYVSIPFTNCTIRRDRLTKRS